MEFESALIYLLFDTSCKIRMKWTVVHKKSIWLCLIILNIASYSES